MKIELDKVIDAMESAGAGCTSYYHIKTGEILCQFEDYEDEEIEEELEENWDMYICMPTSYDIDEYSIMEEFVECLENEEKALTLARAMCGRGAFRRFKDTLYELNIEQKWYDFRDHAYEKIAIRWCEDNDIEYIK